MAFTSNVKWIYPPGGNTHPGQRKVCVRLTGISTDTVNASDAVVIDRSNLFGPSIVPKEPSNMVIEEAEWSISGYGTVILEFDDGTDEELLRLSGAGFKDYTRVGGLHSDQSAVTPGDLLVTTLGAAANASYDITLVIRLKE